MVGRNGVNSVAGFILVQMVGNRIITSAKVVPIREWSPQIVKQLFFIFETRLEGRAIVGVPIALLIILYLLTERVKDFFAEHSSIL